MIERDDAGAVRSARPDRCDHEPLWPTVAVGWAIAATVLTLVSVRSIAHLWFPDPDDAMRMLEVRDWIGGQSWWDVSQHRLNGGDFAMHWSRLVDLPLAAVMVLCDPLFGPAAATRIAMVTVPLLTLLMTMGLAALLTRRMLDLDRAKVAVLLTPLSVPLVYQIRPMRIDHHGWQVALALGAVAALFARASVRSGALAGVALAMLLMISLEGLPITAAIVGVALLAALFDAGRRMQAVAMLWSLLGGLVVLQAATRGPAMLAPACDAIAPAWIAAIAVATLGATGAMLAPGLPRWARFGLLGVAGIAALATLQGMAPVCERGPFATLDPLVYKVWYQNVAEGMPLWTEPPMRAFMMASFPLVGLIGSVFAWRETAGSARMRWTMLIAIAGAGFVLSLLVMRTGATANALAIPGGAWALHALLTRARRVRALPLRAPATAAVMVAVMPGLFGMAMFSDSTAAPSHSATVRSPGSSVVRQQCDHEYDMADLERLPPATIFAPLDSTPGMIAWTHHRGIASGYHRNSAAILRVLATFLGSPTAARAAIAATGAAYVVGCAGSNETEIYKHLAPHGFWARLERGDRFDWLTPVPMPGSAVLVWRVAPAPSPLLSGTAPRP